MNLFLDIETIPDQSTGAAERAAQRAKAPGNMTKPETIAAWREEHRDELWRATALDGTYGEVASIAWQWDAKGGGPFVLTRRADVSEEVLISMWLSDCFSVQATYEARWCGHCIAFDMRFLWQRCVIHRLVEGRSVRLIPVNQRPWHARVWDSCYEWTGKEFGIKLKTLCDALGVYPEAADWDIDGAGVAEAWAKGWTEVIKEHNRLDVMRVRELYRRMVGR